MTKSFQFPLFFAVFLQLFQLLKSYHWSGNTMYDLEYQGSSFIAEANAWGVTSLVNSGVKTTSCLGNTILGGYNVLGGSYATYLGQYWERYYSGLPTHNVIEFSLRFYPVDSWDGWNQNDYAELYFSGTIITLWRLDVYGSPYAITDLCGNTFYEDLGPLMLYATIPHTAGDLTFRVINYLSDVGSNDESLGFREVTMTFSQVASPPSSASFCGITIGYPLPNNACPCLDSQYMTPWMSGNCANCDSTCKTCSAGGSSGCVTCPDARYKSGSSCPACNTNCKTCSGSSTTCLTCNTGWFMVGTTCYPTCNYPLYPEVVGSVTYCRTPCVGQYAFWDGNCGPTCVKASNAVGNFPLSPATVNTFLICNYGCGSTSQVLYWNGTCQSSCPLPLSSSVFHGSTFCDFQCGSSQYLYWNESCSNNCPYPLAGELQGSPIVRRFCWYYCQPGEFMYWNGSCLSTCPLPLASEIQGTNLPRQYCWYPCMPWQWLYWDGTCRESCVAPLWPETQNNRQFCWYSCPSGAKFLYWNGTCSNVCPEPLSTRFENSQWFCDYPCLATQFLYWNASCINSCPAPLTQEIQGNPTQKKFCWYPCPTNQFRYWDNTCQTTCEFPLVPNIQGTPARKFCWYLCQTTDFLYWNGTCLNQCDPPFIQRTTNSRKFCDFPCSSSTQYLYWNTSCLNTCSFPLTAQVQGNSITRSFCWYPCQPNEFLYWNGSCLGSCSAPFIQETQGDPLLRKFCHYPCEPAKYLYWNGSCFDTCPSPLIPEIQGTSHQRKFCWYSCPTTQYLYWNGSCLATCPLPLRSETQSGRKFCWYSCSISQYLYWDQTCQDACPSPLQPEIQNNRQFCWYPCATNEFLYWNGTCKTQCDLPLSQRTSNNKKFCDYPCLPNQFLYWNGSCINSCESPLSPRLEGNPIRKLCDYPCQPTEFLYWDGTCLPTCDFPLTSNTQGTPPRNFCWYLCSTTDYLYWNGTCSSQCNYPVSRQLFKDRRFCNYACPANKFLAPDSSCVDSCPSGRFQNTELYFCQPCQDSLCSVCSLSLGAKCEVCKDQYILNTYQVCQDCQSVSSSLLTQSDETFTYQYKITLSPSTCDLDETLMRQNFLPDTTQNSLPKYSYQLNQAQDSYGNNHFLLEIQFNGSISSGGSLNFAFGSSLKTTIPVPETPKPTQPAPAEIKTTFAAVTGGTVGAALTVGATSALWSIISFQQFMSYFVFMNFPLPEHVVYFLTMFDTSSMESLPNPLESMTNRFSELWDSLVNNDDPKYQLPKKFKEFERPTLFILNAGSTFLINLTLVILPYFFDFLRKFRDLGNQKFMIDIHSNLKWNIPIRVFLESGILLTFGILIQLRKMSFENVPYAISSFCATIAFGYMYLMINYILKTLINFKPEDLKDPHIEMSIGTLFEGLVMKKENSPAKYYYLLVLLRGMLLVFMIVFLDHFPIVQVASMASFNVFFVFYVWKYIQFESRYVTWTSRIKEVLIMVVEFLFMTLISDYNTEHFRNIIGWIIIFMLGLTLTMELLFAFYLQILAVRTYSRRVRGLMKKFREYCKERKQKKKKQQVKVHGVPTLADTSRKMIFIKT